MKNNKKIGGFKTPLFKILSTDETRESLRYAKIHNGYVYASNGICLVKQSLQDFHNITPEECKFIEGKTFHFDLLKQLWAFQQVHFEENKIVAYQGSSASEFEYSTQIVSPDFESVLLYSFENVKQIRLSEKELKQLFAVMHFDVSPCFVFGGENKAVTICNNIDELHIQHGIIMPASMP
jgi:hypothetical protein